MLMTDIGIPSMPGSIRTSESCVMDSEGFEHFIACPPGHVEEELRSLLDWLDSSPYDELITSVLFFHEFESIHPFLDGNGRAGRVLFQILIQELGLKNAKLCMFEYELLKDSETYYKLLEYADWSTDYFPLVAYVAEALLRAYRNALAVFEKKDRLKDMDENSKVLAKKSKAVSELTVADACGWAPTLGEQSVRIKLNELADMGILTKEGRTRSMRYRFKDPFRHAKGQDAD
jgi:Fic family protein